MCVPFYFHILVKFSFLCTKISLPEQRRQNGKVLQAE
nr:MAG TPA: hypothetical protein [Caudoviricetes sp.]